jgi:hypothetical protein
MRIGDTQRCSRSDRIRRGRSTNWPARHALRTEGRVTLVVAVLIGLLVNPDLRLLRADPRQTPCPARPGLLPIHEARTATKYRQTTVDLTPGYPPSPTSPTLDSKGSLLEKDHSFSCNSWRPSSRSHRATTDCQRRYALGAADPHSAW